MKLRFEDNRRSQPDPFIYEENDRYFLYVTSGEGVEAYTADSIDGLWHYEGIIAVVDGKWNYWAPCIAKLDGRYYLYFSCEDDKVWQRLYVSESDDPLGPFVDPVRLFDRFTIDAHVVSTSAGNFLFYAEDNTDTDRIGTRIFVDRLITPKQVANQRIEVITPTFDEEMFKANRYGDGRDWYTIEGAYWFEKDGWQYLMYSGACYENDSYHIGYASAHTDERDLTKVIFEKHTDNGRFSPLMIKNDVEEGTGHNSVIEIDGQYYCVYHGRDTHPADISDEMRKGRYCKMTVENGTITIER